jgi:chitin disaccharide deacetylase
MSNLLRRDQQPRLARAGVILCADDFAMTNGISRAIVELADAGRLSATSAMTTTTHWPSHATWLARARSQIAVGLHLNLTLGRPLTTMPKFAPNRQLPSIGLLTIKAISGRLDVLELQTEIDRQFTSFEAELGFAPDHVDGHQHVHVLPTVRTALLAVMIQRYGKCALKPLIRVPADKFNHTLQRSSVRRKTLALNALSAGFRSAVKQAGFDCNEGFTGVTKFDPTHVTSDFAAASCNLASRHLIMCHPGYVDEELMQLDPVTIRRQREFEALMRTEFPVALWRPVRSRSGDCIDWQQQWAPSS